MTEKTHVGMNMWHMKQCLNHIEELGLDPKDVPISIYDPYTITSFTKARTTRDQGVQIAVEDIDSAVIGVTVETHRPHMNSKVKHRCVRMFVSGFETVNKILEMQGKEQAQAVLAMRNAFSLNVDCMLESEKKQK